MNVRLEAQDLDPEDRKDFEELVSESGKDPGQLLRELVHEALAGRKRNGSHWADDDESVAARQREAIEELIREVDSLPSEGVPAPEARPVSENVDEYLYGWKK